MSTDSSPESLPIRLGTVSRCYVDAAFGIQMISQGYQATFRIEGQFFLVLDGNERVLSPRRPVELCPAFALLYKDLQGALVEDDGTLRLSFEGGAVIRVPPDPDYESWGITTSTGFGALGLPGRGWDSWGEISQPGSAGTNPSVDPSS